MTPIICLQSAGKSFTLPAGEFHALKPVSLDLHPGDHVALVGPSGSGKSTLLNLVSGIERPSTGEIYVAGNHINPMSENDLARFRGRHIGIVFQFFQLVPTLTVLENVTIAMDLVGTVPKRKRRARAVELLDQVGVAGQRRKLPSKLSGGEQQRVAIARALANDPEVLVADEPTGNLDTENSARINAIFAASASEGRTVLIATHDVAHLDTYDRIIRLADGVLAEDRREMAA
jgi:putative ABC transport system ATP-binding protein